MAGAAKAPPQVASAAIAGSGRKICWDTNKNTYANVRNVTSIREEEVVRFGISQASERSKDELELTARIIPIRSQAAGQSVGNLMDEYEKRYASFEIDANTPGDAVKS